jgi:hypothetical protein
VLVFNFATLDRIPSSVLYFFGIDPKAPPCGAHLRLHKEELCLEDLCDERSHG